MHLSLRLAFARTDCTPHDTLCTYGVKQLRLQGFPLSGGFNSDIFVLEALHRNAFEFSIEFRMRLLQIFADAIRTPVRI